MLSQKLAEMRSAFGGLVEQFGTLREVVLESNSKLQESLAQKAVADERANAVDAKLAALGAGFAELQGVIERNCKHSAERSTPLDEIHSTTLTDLIASFNKNKNVKVSMNDERYLF